MRTDSEKEIRLRTLEEVWELLRPVIQAEGLDIFDISMPSGPHGVLRVFLSGRGERTQAGEGKAGGVTLDECALISKRLSVMEGFDDLFSGSWTLEVSSPGINRRLTRPEHFRGAVGERVKIKVVDTESRVGTFFAGILTSYSGEELVIEDEQRDQPVTLKSSEVTDARVDFKFPDIEE